MPTLDRLLMMRFLMLGVLFQMASCKTKRPTPKALSRRHRARGSRGPVSVVVVAHHGHEAEHPVVDRVAAVHAYHEVAPGLGKAVLDRVAVRVRQSRAGQEH